MGLVRTLLWGDEDAEQVFENASGDDHAESRDVGWHDAESTTGFHDIDAAALLSIPRTYDPEQSIRHTLEREAAEATERDVLSAQVGHLALVVESLLRLLKDKELITDLELRRVEQQVDLEDGLADGEYHPGSLPAPTHCPQCEARIPAGKYFCQLCGHRFSTE